MKLIFIGILLCLSTFFIENNAVRYKRPMAYYNVRVMTWNILAPFLVDHEKLQQDGVNASLLNADIRLQMAILEMKDSDPDIINLQEVQEETLKVLVKQLAPKYSPSTFAFYSYEYGKSFVPPGGQYKKNGVITFYKSEKFTLKSNFSYSTSKNGSAASATILQINRRGSYYERPLIIMINDHLQSGFTIQDSSLRVSQGTESLKKANETFSTYSASNPIVIIAGDMNSQRPFPGFTNFINQSYVDAMQHVGLAVYTYYFVSPTNLPYLGVVNGATIDHIFFKASDIASNRVRVIRVDCPAINSKELDERSYYKRLDRINLSNTKNYWASNTYPSTKDGNNVNRVLRLGSDHLPVTTDVVISGRLILKR